MTLRTRRRIFYTLVALFFVIGGGVVFYAQGWRLDFTNWHFTKTGGIYVRAYPENASIFLNGKPVQNQSGFLSPGTLISDLLPRTYRISLKDPGYDDWQENATVLPSLVAQFKYAVLIPQNATSTTSSTIKQITIATLAEAATTTDPFDQNQKIVFEKNKVSIFDISAATTTESSTIAGKNIAVKWISGNTAGILQDDGELYLYDTNGNAGTGSLKKLADSVKNFLATSDGSLIAALEQNSLEVFSLNDSSVYYRFNIPNVATTEAVIWYHDKTHLFIIYPDHVSFLDLADTSLVNFTTIAEGTKPYYDAQTNIFYITDASGKVMQYQFSS